MYTHILIASDGSELAGKGLVAGLGLAAALGARATLVTVSEPWIDAVPGDPGAMSLSGELRTGYLEDRAAAAEQILAAGQARAAAAGVALDVRYVAERKPADAILEVAAEAGADLVVMASHGHRGLRKLLLGSQAQAVLTRGTLPVLVVR